MRNSSAILPPDCSGDGLEEGLAYIQAALAGLRFGVVTARRPEARG
jgi:hypothetical protein